MRQALIALLVAALPAQAQQITEGEDLVMRLTFGDCMDHVRHGTQPFADLPKTTVSDELHAMLPRGALHPGIAIHHILSERYIAVWGQDDARVMCMIRSDIDSGAAMHLLVDPEGFLDRVTARANAMGLVADGLPDEFTPLSIPVWADPDNPEGGIRMVILPTARDGALADAGLIIVSGPPHARAGS